MNRKTLLPYPWTLESKWFTPLLPDQRIHSLNHPGQGQRGQSPQQWVLLSARPSQPTGIQSPNTVASCLVLLVGLWRHFRCLPISGMNLLSELTLIHLGRKEGQPTHVAEISGTFLLPLSLCCSGGSFSVHMYPQIHANLFPPPLSVKSGVRRRGLDTGIRFLMNHLF